jgi:N-formylglutamate amidohydrolase
LPETVANHELRWRPFRAKLRFTLFELLVEQIRLSGYRAALNHPYSGEHILRRHARPRSNVHALQLEVDRSLYLDSHLREPTHLVGSISLLVANLVRALANQALGSATLIAAE